MKNFNFNELRTLLSVVSRARDEIETLASYFGILSPTGQDLSKEQWALANLQMKLQKMLEDYMGKGLCTEEEN